MEWKDKIVIAEKPSVAQSLARVIGADKRKDGYLEGSGCQPDGRKASPDHWCG